jgi:hypothetical protein
VSGPSLAVIVMGFLMVMVSELDPEVLKMMVPPELTPFVAWAMVLKGV